ncbi:MAG TPA: primosomal protein N' [Verrucomicrobiae bacterium]|nr:primosomal protein N' [Verrucomicrobiae bacterium]
MPLEVGFPFRAGPALSYEAPKGVDPKVLLGCRVVVPLGSKKEIGVVIGLDAPRTPGIKTVEKVIDSQPAYLPSILSLVRWAADYYISPLGPALRAAVPGEVQSKIFRKIKFLLPADTPVPDELFRTEKELFFFLANEGEVELKKLASRFPKAALNRHLLDFARRGWIASFDVLEESPGAKKVLCLSANLDFQNESSSAEFLKLVSEIPAKDEKKKHLLLFLLERPGFHPLAELAKRFGLSRTAISALAQRGLVKLEKKSEEERAVFPQKKELVLSAQQKTAFETIRETLGAGRFEPFLLYGVTGSGKTEVYFASIEEVLKQGRQALVLLPEISVASQIITRFRARFGNQVAALHSGLTPGQKAAAWKAVRTGAYPIVVGVRSAVFAPLEKLGLIIVDEEHSVSYKQTEAVPYYHARDAALMRAQIEEIPIVLGSATPSVESFYHAQTGKYKLLELTERFGGQKLPRFEIIDLRREAKPLLAGNLSGTLVSSLKKSLEEGNQAILFLNRRGFSSWVHCSSCGFVFICPRCDAAYTYHKKDLTLRCHLCGKKEKAPTVCPQCLGATLDFRGTGTQRVEEGLASFKDLGVARMDYDTTRKAGAYHKILSGFAARKYHLLLGTQMVTKGLDFPLVNWVGVLSADAHIYLPDFRSRERTFQLLTQVAGRAGRHIKEGKVLIQTYQPENPILQEVAASDYRQFYENEIAGRKRHFYPPFSRLVLLIFSSKKEDAARDSAANWAQKLSEMAKSVKPLEVLGPAPHFLAKLRNRYRWQVLLKTGQILKLIAELKKLKEDWQRFHKVDSVFLDILVDPQSLV